MIPAAYHIDSNEAEGIAVQHVAQASIAGKANKCMCLKLRINYVKVVTHLGAQKRAIEMLNERISTLVMYLNDVEKGRKMENFSHIIVGHIPADPVIIRDISSLCSRLPTQNGEEFASIFNWDVEDVTMMTYLSLLLKNAQLLKEVVICLAEIHLTIYRFAINLSSVSHHLKRDGQFQELGLKIKMIFEDWIAATLGSASSTKMHQRKLIEKQDVVIIQLLNEIKSIYYIVSLDILRLFPLSFLNHLFPLGIPIGSFLNGQELKLMLDLHLPPVENSNVPLSTFHSNDSLHQLLFSPLSENQIEDSISDDIIESQYDNSSDTFDSFSESEPLFETLDIQKSPLALSVTNLKAIKLKDGSDSDLFVTFGQYFLRVLWKDMQTIPRAIAFSESEDDLFKRKEFMFLKEEVDVYMIPKSSPGKVHVANAIVVPNTSSQGLLDSCMEYLSMNQASGIRWSNQEEIAHPRQSKMLTALYESGYVSLESTWTHSSRISNQKKLIAYRIIPLSASNPFSNSMPRLSVNSSSEVGPNNGLITQVKLDQEKSALSAIEHRRFLKFTWWERVPIILNDLQSSQETISGDASECNQYSGIVWLRRSWSFEFSIL